MAAGNDSYGDAAGDDSQSEQPLVAVKPRGRPSNWAKKFAVQQTKDSREQTNKTTQKNDSQQDVQPQHSKSSTLDTVTGRKSPLPSTASQNTAIEAELHTIANEVRRWEAVTQQVATSTTEMTALIRDLAAQSFASRPPSATVRDMLPPEDQARFRDQLLKATQLALKADLVQTMKERDSETRRAQVCCVVVVAVAVVLAAFLVSPFAGSVAEWLERMVVRG
ncbi:hypothetical protein NKR19_g7860 [Coniochaeta hoffmannii]|uniref:Transmembrane protein n=1 Tax=Coniochaeta hoffmannii TaxID=91930 RepID=A0AA38VPA3_9PEZI|nr:hypothetical protein NKR19_g7860 [Coniochaeta hoffmannii]